MEKNKLNSNKELSLLDLWYLFRNNIVFVLSGALIFFVLSFIYAWYILTPNYISKADVMIQVEQDTSSSNDQNFDLVNAFRLIDTVAELMTKEVILDNAVQRLENLGYQEIDIEYLSEGLNINSSSTSYFINISFIDKNEEFSKHAVDAIIEAVIEETDIENAFPVLTDKIRRTSYASNAKYYSPNKIAMLFIGVFLGLTLSYGFIILKESFTTQFKSKDELESALGLQVIGIIPLMEFKEKSNEKK